MKKHHLRILLLLAVASIFALSARAEVIVIANPSVALAALEKKELRNVFTGESLALHDGSHVMPVLLKECSTHTEFLTTYLGKSETTFRAAWRSLVFSGDTMMPKTFDTEPAVVNYVAHTAGTIGYINSKTPHDGVKILTVK